MIKTERCYWKSVVESKSLEGQVFRTQHTEIPFRKCKLYCSGLKGRTPCEHFELREMDLDDYIGRLETFEEGGGFE